MKESKTKERERERNTWKKKTKRGGRREGWRQEPYLFSKGGGENLERGGFNQ